MCILSSCSKSEEEIFIEQMESLTPTNAPMYVQVEDMNDMISTTKANCIIQCTVDSRGTTLLYDPFTGYTKEDLLSTDTSEKEKAVMANYISTPYQLTVSDVYLGDTLETGDSFMFYAPYGEIGEYHCKVSGHPILQVGKEYLLFLRVDKINGEFVYYLSYPPESAIEIGNTAVTGSRNIGNTNVSDNAILDELMQNIEQHEYDTSYDTVIVTGEN